VVPKLHFVPVKQSKSPLGSSNREYRLWPNKKGISNAAIWWEKKERKEEKKEEKKRNFQCLTEKEIEKRGRSQYSLMCP